MRKSWFMWTAILAVVAMASFLGTREFISKETPANAQMPADREPMWFVDEQEEDDRLERFAGTIQGITLSPDQDLSATRPECPDGFVQSESAPNDGPLSPFPARLPAEAEVIETISLSCGSELIATEVSYSIEGDRSLGRLGGRLQVYRFVGEKVFQLDAPTERLGESEVNGRPAVILSPITDDGYGQSAVLINEPWGLTVIRATGMPRAELERIAESLTAGGVE